MGQAHGVRVAEAKPPAVLLMRIAVTASIRGSAPTGRQRFPLREWLGTG
jgi:hypothetical protein